MSLPIALIFGDGPRTGMYIAKAFASNGYRVAVANRKEPDLTNTRFLYAPCDLESPESVEGVFSKVRSELGEPSVVVYNAIANTMSPDPKKPLGLSVAEMQKTLTVNIASPYVAAQQAVASSKALGFDSPKTFIYTGNCLNFAPIPPLLTLGVGKSSGAHLMLHLSGVYKEKGVDFYYADERNMDGSPAYGKIDGPAHGEFYLQLAKGDNDIPWLATFVKGHGYKQFEEVLRK